MKSEKVNKMFELLLPALQMAEPSIINISYHKWNVYEEIAAIHYKGGHVEAINISANSLSATMKEIVNMTTARACQGWIKEIPEGLKEIINQEVTDEHSDS